MKQPPRICYTDTQKALMWERWRAGDSLQSIAQLFDRNHSSIQRILPIAIVAVRYHGCRILTQGTCHELFVGN